MSTTRKTSKLEQAIIALLEQQGYPYHPGHSLERAPGDALLKADLRDFLSRRYAGEQNVGWISVAHPPYYASPPGQTVLVDALRLSTLQSKEAMQYEPVSTRRCAGRHLLFYGGDL